MVIEFIQTNPKISILILSFLVTLAITIVNYLLIDKTKMREIKERQKALREEMKKVKDNPEKMMEINKKMLADMPEQLRASFKPLLITFVPILIMFSWLKATFATTAIASTWFWWYIGASLVSSIILRKLFGLQ